jgi:hypothetical protein
METQRFRRNGAICTADTGSLVMEGQFRVRNRGAPYLKTTLMADVLRAVQSPGSAILQVQPPGSIMSQLSRLTRALGRR